MDRRVRKTRALLRQGLTQLMKTKRVKDITVRELADLVDINRGTFYIHYKDIYDMVEQIENDMFAEFNELVNAHSIEELSNDEIPIVVELYKYMAKNADMCTALLGPNGDPLFVDRMKNLVRIKCLQEYMKIYHTGETNDFDYYYSFMVSGCLGLFKEWLFKGMPETPEQMSVLTGRIIADGLKNLKKNH